MVRLAQTMQLYCVKISTICKQTETSFHLILVTYKYHRVHPKQFLSLWYVRCKPCTYIAPTLTLFPNRPKWDSTWPTHLGVPSGASKMISGPMECPAQTAHLSCVKISTISKWTQTCFYLSLITKEYHRVCPKRFLSLWYVRRKPCTYLVSRLALSPNGMKRASTWDSSPWSTIGCVQIDFWAYGTIGANPA
jgi:hypothetical protein